MTPQVGLVTQQYQTTIYDILIYKVSTQRDPLRLRSGPGTDYRILGKYAKETEIIVLDKSNSGWYEVTCPDGKHGYMSSEYLTYVRTDTGLNQSNVGFHNQTIQSRQLRDQPFRIYRVVPELDKVTVYARHVFYDLLDNMIQSLKPSPDAVGASVVQSLSASCLSGHGFTFYSDLTSSAEDVEWENKNPVEAMLGEGGLVEKYGAELARDWFDVFLVQRVGHDSDVQIRERKNLTGISYDVDETDVVTRIMPTGQDADGNILYLPELYSIFQHRQCVRFLLRFAFFYIPFYGISRKGGFMTQNTPVMKMTRRYGRTVYEVAAYCSPDSKATYEDRLLQLIRHAAKEESVSDSCSDDDDSM